MPEIKPDRDDRRQSLDAGGPQDGGIGDGSDERQQRGEAPSSDGGLDGGDTGEGAQRNPGGSSRDIDQR